MDPSSSPEVRQGLLKKEPSTVSDYSIGSSPTIIGSPSPNAHHRPGYRRATSSASGEIHYHATASYDGAALGDMIEEGLASHGLGIATSSGRNGRNSIARVPVGSKQTNLTSNPNDRTVSPATSRNASRDFSLQDTEAARLWGVPSEDRSAYGSKPSSTFQTPLPTHDTERLLHKSFSTSNNASNNGKWDTRQVLMPYRLIQGVLDHNSSIRCPSKKNIYEGRGNWLSVVILILAIYSTILSGVWLIIAMVKPRYGQSIKPVGGLAPSTASLLCALFAKTIELSFVTVFVAFLGQVLSRRAFIKNSKGITIAEMSLRSWIMQPGTMITHWESVRYAAWTFLGMVALTATFLAMLYTTASDALVSPKLKLGKLQDTTLYGRVATKFANPTYVASKCQTPIQAGNDINAGTTCLDIEHAGQAFHNYQQWLSTWTELIASGSSYTELSQRPPPVGMLYDNTTVRGTWINIQNMTELSSRYGQRIINNVSMAMPHSGVFTAARDPLNQIMQPETLDGLGEYNITASVPSPAVNVLCATMTKEDMEPMVYMEWPNADRPFNASAYPPGPPFIPNYGKDEWLNTTNVDDLFGFGKKYGRRHPIFPKLPMPYNTILNTTGWFADSIYLLGASANSEYVLCSLRATQYPKCSTEYHASLSGGSLRAYCDDDPNNRHPYSFSHTEAPVGVVESDWKNIASEWSNALSLNNGITDGKAANARLLTQLIPATPALDPSLPSIAEALAVLAGCTLLISAQDAPFIHYWNYSTTVPTLAEPQHQAFKATLQTQDYASGGAQPWQSVFYIVLALVFAMNIFCLIYFIIRGGLVTDFIEPQNLFSLSINSPPSGHLAGSCGGGPEKDQFKVNWFINVDGDHVFIENGRKPSASDWRSKISRPSQLQFEAEGSPVASMYAKLSNKRTSLL